MNNHKSGFASLYSFCYKSNRTNAFELEMNFCKKIYDVYMWCSDRMDIDCAIKQKLERPMTNLLLLMQAFEGTCSYFCGVFR
jgi:hypothetical protein